MSPLNHMVKTPREFASSPACCPACGSGQIHPLDPPEILPDGRGSQHFACRKCRSTWTGCLAVCGYTDLNIPAVPERMG